MQLFYGSYGSLQQSFLDFVAKTRQNPLEKWLVVCASSLMAQELKKKLAHRFGALANIHFCTLGGLMSRLDESAGPALPLLPQDHLRDFLIKELLSQPPLNRYPVSYGFIQAVKSSLRDLGDSQVDPNVWEDYVRSLPDDIFMQVGDRLLWLIYLYRRYQTAENQVKGYRSYQNAFERALKEVENSTYLHTFEHIVFYGFYDMSGRQLELMREMRLFYPITVFAPYENIPAYRFAEKFFEANWASAQNTKLPPVPSALGKSGACLFVPAKSEPCSKVQVVSTADFAGEVFFVAKEILRLREQGYPWEDIGIIARNTEPYQEELRRSFAANKIPLDATFSYPIKHYALGLFCLDLFALHTQGFSREAVLKILLSPYFKHPQKQAWAALVQDSLVSRDLSQWNDLLPQTKHFDPELLSWLTQTAQLLEKLSQAQAWKDGVSLALSFLKETVDDTAFEGKDAEVFEAVCHAIETIELYSVIRAQSHPGELPEELENALSALSFQETEAVTGGVRFLDAIRARGLSFKIVFVLGLNDATFPLVTAEDPILHDYYRYMLRDVLGYWINQSLHRADEEKLLFFAAVTSATEQVYVSYNRYGPDGKDKVVSLFVSELARAAQLPWPQEVRFISGRMAEQLKSVPLSFLTQKEISYFCSLFAQNALTHYQQAGLLTPDKGWGIAAAQALSRSGEMSLMDGKIHSGEDLFQQENKKGFSASSLQKLAQCPLRYFLEKGLHLGEEDEPLSRHELSADRKGTLMHQILCDFYQTLFKNQQTHDLFEDGLKKQLQESALRCRPAQGGKTFGLYPLVWELIWQELVQALMDFVVEDARNLENFTPSHFEMNLTVEPTDVLPCRLNGTIDRVDLQSQTHQFRIIDYKSSKKGTKSLDNDFFKSLVFQPFLYPWMALHHPHFAKDTFESSCLISLKPKYEKRTLKAEKFHEITPRALAFLNFLIGLIRQGIFFVSPSNACTYCPYGTLCRRNSYKSLMRASKSEMAQTLMEVRK